MLLPPTLNYEVHHSSLFLTTSQRQVFQFSSNLRVRLKHKFSFWLVGFPCLGHSSYNITGLFFHVISLVFHLSEYFWNLCSVSPWFYCGLSVVFHVLCPLFHHSFDVVIVHACPLLLQINHITLIPSTCIWITTRIILWTLPSLDIINTFSAMWQRVQGWQLNIRTSFSLFLIYCNSCTNMYVVKVTIWVEYMPGMSVRDG